MRVWAGLQGFWDQGSKPHNSQSHPYTCVWQHDSGGPSLCHLFHSNPDPKIEPRGLAPARPRACFHPSPSQPHPEQPRKTTAGE